MGFYDSGNPPINSTTGVGVVTAPSTSSLIAEIDSTQLGTVNYTTSQQNLFRVTWIVGADTSATWYLEQVPSTALTTATNATTIIVKSPTAQSAQYVTNHRLGQNDRLRVRMLSTGVNACASIQAEAIT